MKLASRGQNQYWEEQRFRLFRLRKRIHQRLRYRHNEPKKVLLISGCQRSGTSMIHHLFRKDVSTVTYDEYSKLSTLQGDEPLRWRPMNEILPIIKADRSPLVVTKPLVEAQNLGQWLDAIPEARAIWMFRDVRDVVASSQKYFGENVGPRDLAPIIGDNDSDWRSENLPTSVSDLVKDLASDGLTPSDSAALFWYVRNSLFFAQNLAHEPRAKLCQYEQLVLNPVEVMKSGYNFLGRPFPGQRVVEDVIPSSIRKGKDVVLSSHVEQVCREMFDRLMAQPRLG